MEGIGIADSISDWLQARCATARARQKQVPGQLHDRQKSRRFTGLLLNYKHIMVTGLKFLNSNPAAGLLGGQGAPQKAGRA